jgi:hypothetical protein
MDEPCIMLTGNGSKQNKMIKNRFREEPYGASLLAINK